MQNKLIHTPEGVRDIYGNEYKKKLILQHRIQELIKSFGYENIQTPSIEFFDIFSSEIGTIPSKELYKFFDKEGNTLVLRPDFTPSIARCSAKYFLEEKMPLRFSYIGNTFINTSDYQGRLKETTQIGAELINDGSVEADVELLLMLIKALKKCNLNDFQVSIGNLEFFKGLCSEYGINDETELDLREMINDKNYFATQDILDSLELDDNVKNIFMKMPEMFGSIDKINEAKNFVTNKRSLMAIERLNEIYDLLKRNNVENYISFDLGMLSKYNYYTGIIFRAYTYGSGDAIIKGGRYDNLLNEFGKKAEAIGFAIELDRLISVLDRQKIAISLPEENKYLISYSSDNINSAFDKANEIRSNGDIAVMISKNEFDADAINSYCESNSMKLIEI